MADFSAKETELSAPRGAGAQVIAPVQRQFVDTSPMPLVESVSTALIKGTEAVLKNKAKQANEAFISQYNQQQAALNEAVATNQISAATAATRSRALFNSMAASATSEQMDMLNKARTAFSGGSELGVVEDAVKQAADIQKQRITNAQNQGVSIYSWMDSTTLEKTLSSAEASKRAEVEFDRVVKRNVENRAQNSEERTLQDREVKQARINTLTQIAGNNIDRLSSLTQNLGARVTQGMPTEEAQLVLNTEFAQVSAALQAAAGTEPELASSYRSLFNDIQQLGTNLLDPKKRSETSAAQFNEVINRAKLVAVQSDPKIKAVVVANELLGGQAAVALNAAPALSEYIAKASQDPENLTNNVQMVGNPDIEKDGFSLIVKSLQKIDNQGFKDNAKAEEEAINVVNNSLTQMSDLMKTGKASADRLVEAGKFVASPEFGRLVAAGKVNKEALEAAKIVFQTQYGPAVQTSIRNQLNTLSTRLGQSGGGIQTRNITEALSIEFDGAGVKFVPKDVSLEPFQARARQRTLAELDKAKAGLNQLIHIGAHMGGYGTDYSKYWDDNKHLLLPEIYPDPVQLKPGQTKNGYIYLGGPYGDRRSWKKAGE